MQKHQSYNCSFEELEKRFALHADSWLRQKIETGNLSTNASNVFVKARIRCAKHLKRKETCGLNPVVNEFLDRMKFDGRARAIANLNRILGTLVERFGASSGWLFISRGLTKEENPKLRLDELLAHNVPLNWRKHEYFIDFEESAHKELKPTQSVLICLKSRQGYLLNQSHTRFRPEISSSLSQIVVPIFSTDSTVVEGVLNRIKNHPKKLPAGAWMNGERSFTAFVAGCEHSEVVQGQITQMPNFHRPEKASRMGVEYIISAPIYEMESDHSSGVLSLYFYRRRQLRLNSNIGGGFSEHDVVWLSDTIGRVIAEAKSLRQEVAIATILARIHEEGIPHLNLVNYLRDEILKILDAEACTIFLGKCSKQTSTVELKVLSTTGLTSNEKRSKKCGDIALPGYFETSCKYKKEVNTTYVKVHGIAAFLAMTPGSTVRKADEQDPWEIGCWKMYHQCSSTLEFIQK